MAADVSRLLEQLLRSDAEVHGTRSFGSNTGPIDKLLQGGRHSEESGARQASRWNLHPRPMIPTVGRELTPIGSGRR